MNLTHARAQLDDLIAEAVRDDPLEGLRSIAAVQRDLAAQEGEAVRAAVRTHTWSEVGAALGVSKQAVHQRYTKAWAHELAHEARAAAKDVAGAKLSGDRAARAEAKARLEATVAELKQGAKHRNR